MRRRDPIEQAGWTRRCPVDDSEHFPRTDPAVIMLVHDGGDRCLLGRGAVWPPGRYSTLAGFVEPGESLESAVIREVFEEVGVVVDDVPLRRQPAVAVPVIADAGLHGARRRRGGGAARQGRDGRGRLVHPREVASGRRLDGRGRARSTATPGVLRAIPGRGCRSRAS